MKRLAAILTALLVLQGLSVSWAYQQDYCSQSDGRPVLLLIDRTSPFDEQDKQVFAHGIDTLFRQLQAGDRLVVHTLTADFSSSDKIFDACRPGCREQGLVGGLFSDCRESVARLDDRKYLRDLLGSIKPMIDEQEKYPASEIIETIAFMQQEYGHLQPARLVIFSDMIEHSQLARFAYLEQQQIETLLERLERLGLVGDMHGVTVEVFGYGRHHGSSRSGLKPEQKRNIEQFWREYFRRAGVAEFRLGRNL
jgi:hypothetical protein